MVKLTVIKCVLDHALIKIQLVDKPGFIVKHIG